MNGSGNDPHRVPDFAALAFVQRRHGGVIDDQNVDAAGGLASGRRKLPSARARLYRQLRAVGLLSRRLRSRTNSSKTRSQTPLCAQRTKRLCTLLYLP